MKKRMRLNELKMYLKENPVRTVKFSSDHQDYFMEDVLTVHLETVLTEMEVFEWKYERTGKIVMKNETTTVEILDVKYVTVDTDICAEAVILEAFCSDGCYYVLIVNQKEK